MNMTAIKSKLETALKFIEENEVLDVNVRRNLHYNQDEYEGMDFTGLHSVDIVVRANKLDDLMGVPRVKHHVFSLDLEGYSPAEVKATHLETFLIVKEFFPNVTRTEQVHH